MISNFENPSEFLAAMRKIQTDDELEPHQRRGITGPMSEHIERAKQSNPLVLSISLHWFALTQRDAKIRDELFVCSQLLKLQAEQLRRAMSVIAQHEQLQSLQRGELPC